MNSLLNIICIFIIHYTVITSQLAISTKSNLVLHFHDDQTDSARITNRNELVVMMHGVFGGPRDFTFLNKKLEDHSINTLIVQSSSNMKSLAGVQHTGPDSLLFQLSVEGSPFMRAMKLFKTVTFVSTLSDMLVPYKSALLLPCDDIVPEPTRDAFRIIHHHGLHDSHMGYLRTNGFIHEHLAKQKPEDATKCNMKGEQRTIAENILKGVRNLRRAVVDIGVMKLAH
jgi:hypothetical protein